MPESLALSLFPRRFSCLLPFWYWSPVQLWRSHIASSGTSVFPPLQSGKLGHQINALWLLFRNWRWLARRRETYLFENHSLLLIKHRKNEKNEFVAWPWQSVHSSLRPCWDHPSPEINNENQPSLIFRALLLQKKNKAQKVIILAGSLLEERHSFEGHLFWS